MWCCRILLRVPWTGRRSNQSILKEINPEYSLEGLMLKLKLQYFGHLMRRANSLEKMLILGKIESRRRGDRGWDGWMASPIQWTWVWVDSGSWWWTGRPGVLRFMGSQRVEQTEWLNCKRDVLLVGLCESLATCWSFLELQWRLQLHTLHVCFAVTKLCPTLCDPMNCGTPGFPVPHHLPELVQSHVHQVGDAIQPSHPLSSPSPPAFNLSQHQGLF